MISPAASKSHTVKKRPEPFKFGREKLLVPNHQQFARGMRKGRSYAPIFHVTSEPETNPYRLP